MADLVANTRELVLLAEDMRKAKRQMLGRLAERGYQLLREEVPKVTRNLMQGVAPPEVDYEKLVAVLTVSARSARVGSQTGTVIGADGKEKKKVTLRGRPAFNYAAAVAEGRPAIRPRKARALLIPVPSAPNGESYMIAGGQIYVFRTSAKEQKPNPYHERAAARLEGESAKIGESVLAKFV
jgi:hypothetical protein